MPAVNKRATLPGASELFRPTKGAPDPVAPQPAEPPPPKSEPKRAEAETPAGGATGRVKHDHKITVYFSEDELNALEDANLELRRTHGIRVDRGRIVRMAVARAIADLAANGADSHLVSELRQQ
ncbi:hypothetical protein SAMN05428934_11350 [Tessaracoccus flavus]|nr:hypothetical protein [Tessaracoccus flavus]SDZ16969.1 hypothetical protein SAMN05428934_11350 [Tessaracoccus flavus]